MNDPWSIRTIIITWGFFPLSANAWISNSRSVVIAALAALIMFYPLSVVWTAAP